MISSITPCAYLPEIGYERAMYSVLNYGHMAADGVRMDAYARAIERAVKPGNVVLDIGAGTGIFTLLAARAGARRVHAVDPNPAVWLIPELARENGLEGRVEIHHTSSYDLSLPERADVVIADLRGSVPTHGDHFAVLRDAKARLLAPGGVLIPERDELYVGAFENDEVAAWLARASAGFERRGWSAEAVRRSVSNTPVADGGRLRASDLLTTSAPWATIVYGEENGLLEGEVELVARRRGTAHGLAVWFEATILGDLRFSTEPGMAMVYSRFILPLLDPIELEHGDRVRLVLRVDEQGQRWAWETAVAAEGGATKARARQSSFFGMPTSPEALLRGSSSFAPVPSPLGERAREILARMDGSRTVAEIAAEMAARPDAPRQPGHALLEEVRDLVARYGR